MTRERVALGIAALGAVGIAALGLRVYLADGSYFLGEASVVLSLDELSIRETFTGNLLAGGQNFPRVYLLAIRLVRLALGDSTLATRLLPQLFFLGATALWMRLLWLRFRRRPAVLLFGVVLLAAVPTWPIYGAAVKQYSFDVFCVLALFSVPDRVLDASLRGGARRARLVALALPVALSYTYGVALLARVLGWYAWRARRDGFAVDARACLVLAGSFAALSAALWWTDVRHTLGQQGLFEFWQSCTLPAPPGESLPLLERFLLGWYERHVEFMVRIPLPAIARAVLVAAIAGGVGRVAASIARAASPADDAWGSRSAGCAAGVAGAIATSFALDYPICSGRLVLWVLFFQQMLLLEGVDGMLALAARRRPLRVGAIAVFSVLVGFLAATALRNARDLVARVPIEDVRRHLAVLDTAPELPVLVTSCMELQIRTLPEGLGDRDVTLQPFAGGYEPLPFGEEVFVIHSMLFRGLCPMLHRQLVALTTDATPRGEAVRGAEVLVYRTRFLTSDEVGARIEALEREPKRRGRARGAAR